MKKFLVMMMCVIMVIAMMPGMAFADSQNPCKQEPCTHVASIGDVHYDTFAEAVSDATEGNEIKILVAGPYNVPTGKNVTITGAVDGVVFNNIGACGMGGANVTFNNVTFDYYPNVNYTGLQHSGNLVYNKCTFKGQVFLYGASETFNDCTFNQNSADAYNVWTYGAKKVEFNRCTFNCAGKSVLIYSEDKNLVNDVVVTDCDFIASAPVEDKAAIEMDSSIIAGIKLTIDSKTTVTGFGKGGVSGDYLWNNKKSDNDITVTVGGKTFLSPTYTAAEVTCVAQVGSKIFTSLQEAIAAAKDGDTVTLLKNVTLDTTQNITKNITIDLNSHNITGNDVRAFHVQKGTLNLTGVGTVMSQRGSTLEDASSVIRVGNNDGESATAGLVIGKDVIISAPDTYGVTVFGKKTTETVTVYGTVQSSSTHVGDAAAISGVGSPGYEGTTINIESSAVVTSANDAAIYHPQAGTLNIKGGTISGKGGIEAKAGIINVTGAPTITANVAKSHTPNGNGTSTSGYAIAAVENNGYAGSTQVNISGGTFTGSVAIVEDNVVDTAKKGKIVVTGGTFSADPTEYLANSNYYVTGKGPFTVYYSAPYVPTTPATPTDNVTNSGSTTTDNAATNADLSGSTSTSNGTTSSTVDKTTADKIVDKAVENKSTEVVIDATANSTTAANSTTTAQVTIPTETLGAIAEKTEADVTIKTDVAEVKLDNTSAAAVAEQAEGDTVQIIAEKVAEETDKVEFELKVVCSDGKVISDFKGGNVAVTVALPKAMADKKVVCVYIDDNGHMSKVEGQKNADGTYTFNTGHFSSYAIMAEEEADAAIAAQKEAIKNIKIKLTSKQVKTKAGKKAVKITWTAAAGDKTLDGVEVFRSKEKNKGYGTEPFYTSTKGGNTGSYTNTKSLKKGTKYYYRVRGYVLVNGEKVYTDYSTKAWRTVK